MKRILVLGAGLSSSSLIRYFLDRSEEKDWIVRVGDLSFETANTKAGHHPRGEAFAFDVQNSEQCRKEIAAADIVISMLPASMHFPVAEACVSLGKNLVTASYISPEIRSLDQKAREKGVLLMNECGVDPGIDHMSAVKLIEEVRAGGGRITAFESSTGGLVAPGYENNPWKYKFTWNPRNVVLAGKDGARFLHNGKFKYIPYHKLFQRIETIFIPELGEFEVYGNRDSLQYRETYGLHDLQTMFRGTIRRPGYCEAWDTFVQLGATDDSYRMEDTENMTYREFINSFMAYSTGIPVETKLATYLRFGEDSEMMKKLKWLGIFENTRIGVPNLTPAKILQKILEEKWKLEKNDKDMILMQHQVDYEKGGKHFKQYATLVCIGQDTVHTAMALTVGLPVAIAARLILEGKYRASGVKMPIEKAMYEPVLNELAEFGISFTHEEKEITV